MNVFIEYDPSKEKIDFSQDIINFLYKKLGAFSSTQSDAVLPLINNSELFGAIKLQFINPVKNNEVNKIWKEIKIFSSLFYETYFSTPTIESEDEINTLSTSDFQNMLQKKFSSTGNFSLILFKVLKTKLSNNLDYRVSVILRKILKISVDVYKLNDDTYSLVITKDSFSTLEQNIGMFLGELINEDPSIEICISNAFTYPNTKNIDDWYRTALSSLKIAVSKGANKFHFVH